MNGGLVREYHLVDFLGQRRDVILTSALIWYNCLL